MEPQKGLSFQFKCISTLRLHSDILGFSLAVVSGVFKQQKALVNVCFGSFAI